MATARLLKPDGTEAAQATVTVTSGTTVNATVANHVSVINSAAPGTTVLLASGAYPWFQGAVKTGNVTIAPQAGATVTMDGASLSGSAFLTLQGIKFTSGVAVRDSAHHIVFDGCTFDNLGTATWEGRLSFNLSAHDNTVKNCHFGGNSKCSDGVFVGDSSNNTIGPGNVFDGILQGSCSAHCDAIQLFKGPGTKIIGNLFLNCDTHIMAPDGNGPTTVTDNVFIGAGYVPTVQLGSQTGSTFIHNTCRNIGVHMDSKTGGTASRNGIIKDNIVLNGYINTTNGSGCTGCTVSNNLMSGAVFVGGTNPTTYLGHKLTSSSPGHLAGTDGLDQGIRA